MLSMIYLILLTNVKKKCECKYIMVLVRGIGSSRLTNQANCGGVKKAGLAPSHGYMRSGVSSVSLYKSLSVQRVGDACGDSYVSRSQVRNSFPWSMM